MSPTYSPSEPIPPILNSLRIASDSIEYQEGDHIRLKNLDELIRTNQVTKRHDCYHFRVGDIWINPGYHPDMWKQCQDHDNHLIISIIYSPYGPIYRCEFPNGEPFMSDWWHRWNVIPEFIEGLWVEDDGSLPI